MKFSCKTQEFLQALQLVGRAISGQQTLPILSNILIRAEGKRCTLTGTDLELSIMTSFEASIENEGSITVPAKAILNFAQFNDDPDVLLETSEGTQLKCTSRHAKTLIAGEAASEYPTIANIERKTTFSLPAQSLLNALLLVTFTTARSTLRPVLSGVFLRIEHEKLVLVATDSYRLSEYAIPAKGLSADVSCIVPVKVLEELKMILGSRSRSSKTTKDEKEDVIPNIDVTLSAQQIELHIGPTRLLSRLIDGKFPDYQQIVPKKFALTVMMPVRETITAVKRMHYFTKEMNNNLTFTVGRTEARLKTPATQLGRDEATIPVETNRTATESPSEVKIALSSSYLLDFLTRADAESVELCIEDSLHPAVFHLPSHSHFLHLIMPLRLHDEA